MTAPLPSSPVSQTLDRVAEAIRLRAIERGHPVHPVMVRHLAAAAIEAFGFAQSSQAHLQARGRHYDIIQQAIASYDEWMKDDDYDAIRKFRETIDRMRERVAMTDAPTLSDTSTDRPKCKLCGLEDGACICAHIPAQPQTPSMPQNVEVAIKRMQTLADSALEFLYDQECKAQMLNAIVLLQDAYSHTRPDRNTGEA